VSGRQTETEGGEKDMLSLWNPFSELMRVGEHFERWPFDERRFSPAVDVREEADSILVEAELPGMKPEDVSVNLEGNLLTISGERKFEHEKKEEGYRRIERSYGSFSRSFTLPDTVALERCEAEMNNGILKIRVPKSEKAQPRRIDVKSSEKLPGTVTPGYAQAGQSDQTGQYGKSGEYGPTGYAPTTGSKVGRA
jgi:HSP20 family protein